MDSEEYINTPGLTLKIEVHVEIHFTTIIITPCHRILFACPPFLHRLGFHFNLIPLFHYILKKKKQIKMYLKFEIRMAGGF